ncbi:DNA polymerase III subunit delta' [Salinibacillus xinjiangensis]|uniref:DNA polymerase III subunit delta n=1 Tax=Salinibacillus xinjiangensis TaxID=1229268 RepID=A0A6G1XB77_9BACI|nr:DNA polymerase III subunit delta' [Salinibacillus xinjiangensis]MRG88156.1 DNA polymerase III subunit delta' [Salinibacillus xinjiangensis]
MNTWGDFENVQPIVAKMLENSIKKNRISHAYLFQGPKGTGKKESSFLLAKSFFCKYLEGFNPCNECRDCKRIESGNHPDVHPIQPDGQSIKKEQITHLQKEFTYTGMESNQKVYIIEHADTMTANAANQLLKFLEEPKRSTMAILLTENGQSILNTIRSRCQTMSFKALNTKQLESRLVASGISEPISKFSAALTNDFEEAERISQDDWFAKGRTIVIKLIQVLMEGNDEAFLFLHNDWLPHFKDKDQSQIGLDLLLIWYRDYVSYLIERKDTIIYIDEKEKFEKYTFSLSRDQATKALKKILEAKNKLKANVNPTLVMEELVLQIQR